MDLLFFNPYFYDIIFYGSLALLPILLFSIISSARKNGVASPRVKYSISSFLFALLIYLFAYRAPIIFSIMGFSDNSIYNFFSSKILGIPVRLWVIFIPFLLSLFFSIRAWRGGRKNLAILLMIFDALLLLYVFMGLLAAAWINAML